MTRSALRRAAPLLTAFCLAAIPAGVLLQEAFPGGSPRRSARVLVPGGGDAPVIIRLEYGAVPWGEALEGQLVDPEGAPWMLGDGFWSALDANADLEFQSALGGRIAVPAGHYYLTLRRGPDVPARETLGPPAVWILALHDPASIRAARLQPQQAGRLRGGIQIPLARRDVQVAADHLAIGMNPLDRQASPRSILCALTIDFGEHRFLGTFNVGRTEPAAYLPDPGPRLSAQDRRVLESADSLDIYAIRPVPNSLMSDLNPGPSIQGYGIRGQATVEEGAERTKVLQWVYRAVAGDFAGQARCFMPRHAVVATKGEQQVTLLLCFECHAWRGSGSGGSLGGQMSAVDKTAVNAFWKSKGLEIAD